MEKIITVSIIGVGARGGEAYGRYIYSLKDKYKIVALCDVNEERLEKYGETYGIEKENRFTDEDEFFAKKRSDLILIKTVVRERRSRNACADGANDGYLGYEQQETYRCTVGVGHLAERRDGSFHVRALGAVLRRD